MSTGAGGLSSEDQVKASKSFSYILRHGAVKEGYTMTEDGYVAVDEIRKWGPKAVKHLTDAQVRYLVETNAKQRFALKSVNGALWIRANQGHSAGLGLAEDKVMKEITDVAQAPVAVHGTYKKAWPIIQKEGLSKMARQHVHFAKGLPGDNGVISGMRTTAEVLIYLDVEKCLADGVKLYLSDNGVVLSPGDSRGIIPPKYFKDVVTS
eukprot:TRINITY_DN822_c0_g1_i1.p2 TRINITY_DN822_c0_g1~~TRINITY_DN822_c0_g1_i1.p2  ORF type:complete len:208 (+),score=90.02 TRINITY_DN822_c0_g1_i1:87-710(+)